MMISVFLKLLCSLLIPISESKNIGRFWHVTDFHYDHTYFSSGLSCNGPVPRPGPYGDYWCDSPWALVQSAADFLAQKTAELSDIDFAIWTGDTVAHITNEQTDVDQNIEILKNVTGALEAALRGVPVYASLGNHDFYPNGQADPETEEFYRRVGSLWEGWISSQAQVERFEDGGYYAKTLPSAPKIRLLALNTNFYYTYDKLTATMEDPAGQFVWMEAQLQEARSAKQKVILTAHVPPGLLTPGLVDWFYPEHKKRFMDIVFRYFDVISVAHFGHDHEDGFKILQNSDGSRSVAQFSAPSVTPWRYKYVDDAGVLREGKPHNPALRLVEFDRETGAQLDYTQYFINLTESNTKGKTEWAELYTFTEAYDVPDLSVDSLRRIFRRMESGGGRQYSEKFCRFGRVSRLYKPCTDRMKGEIYCGGLMHNLTEASDCVHDYLQRISSNSAKVTTAYIGLICFSALLSGFIMFFLERPCVKA